MKNPKPDFKEGLPNIHNLWLSASAKCYDGQLNDIRYYAKQVDIDMYAESMKKLPWWKFWR